jgi:glycosyltransferase involved in cell wall biosynthesis
LDQLLQDGWLRERAHMEHLNTTPDDPKLPAAFTLANARLALIHAVQVFRRARTMDVVHLNLAPVPLLPLLRALLLCVAARAAGSRAILHAHTGRLSRHVGSPLYRLVLRSVGRMADRIVVVSAETERALRALGIPAVQLQNGIAVTGIDTGPKATDPPTLVFVGTVCERKGLIELRDALVALRDEGPGPPLRVVVVGDAAQEGPGVHERIRRAYAVADLTEVEFLGARERSEVMELLSAGSIFCLPSHWEGFPLSVLEAMAAGMAVVATAVGDVPMMLDHGKAGILVPPGDPLALARAIDLLRRDPRERALLGEAARRRAEDAFDQGRMVRRIYALYGEVLTHSM